MLKPTTDPGISSLTLQRASELFSSHQQTIYKHTDRLFAVLMSIQWVAGIAAALWISPRAWIGTVSQTHVHVWAAVFLGAAINFFPIFLAVKRPGEASTRYVIATGQMMMSALLIHLTGGRIETHFHVFGSLAFLSFYRDWRVLVPATVVVAADHFLRGIFWPESAYGVLSVSQWRWLEHAGWVLFEDAVLYVAIKRSVTEMWAIAVRTAQTNDLNESLEQRVAERTAEIVSVNDGLQREITERKLAESALRDSEGRYRLLFESNPLPMWVYDFETLAFLAVNEAASRHYGYSREEFLSMTIGDIRPPDAVPVLLGSLSEASAGMYQAGVWKHRKKDGTIIDVEITSHALDFAGLRAKLVLANDVTERRRVEKERQVVSEIIQGVIATSNLDELFELIHASISKLLYAENCFVALYDLATDLVHFEFWLDKNDPVPAPRPVGRGFGGYVLRTGQPLLLTDELKAQMYEQGDVDGDGISSPSWLGVPLRTPARTMGVLVVHHHEDKHAYSPRDLEFLTSVGSQIALAIERKRAETGLRNTEDQLRQSQKMEAVGRLAGGIAHDFNNLLTAITGYSDLALRELDQNSPLRSRVQEIRRAGDRAASLTRQLLAFSRKQILQPRVLDLNAVIPEMNKMLRRMIGEDIVLQTVLDGSLGRVKADPGQMEQILMNLAINARDAMPNGGRLTIETKNMHLNQPYVNDQVVLRAGQYVMLSVSDNGCGMDTETQAQIFEPFFTTKEVGKGTGLGLSTVYGIVKQSEGSIWVYSEVGKGTAFKIYLPRIDEVEQREDPDELQAAPCGHETVLLVEDEEMVRTLSTEVLEHYGYTVIAAANGEEGLRVCEEFKGNIDLMITDVVMPNMSGPELAERLAVLRPETQVLYMSGFTDDAIFRHGLLDEDMSFLQKPFSPDSLATKAREVLDHRAIAGR